MKTAEADPVETRRSRRAEKDFEPEAPGLAGSIRHLLATALAMFQSRVELIAVELSEEKKRVASLAGWGIALVFLSVMTLVAIMGTIVFLLWENAMAVLIGFSAFFLVAAIGSFLAMHAQLKKIPFQETVDQLKKDRELVSGELP